MAILTVALPEAVKQLAESRAAAAGYPNVAAYLTGLIEAEATGAPEGLDAGAEEQLEVLLLSRADGTSIAMDKDDFRQLREKLSAQIDGTSGPTR